jgi:hypothetical protein
MVKQEDLNFFEDKQSIKKNKSYSKSMGTIVLLLVLSIAAYLYVGKSDIEKNSIELANMESNQVLQAKSVKEFDANKKVEVREINKLKYREIDTNLDTAFNHRDITLEKVNGTINKINPR